MREAAEIGLVKTSKSALQARLGWPIGVAVWIFEARRQHRRSPANARRAAESVRSRYLRSASLKCPENSLSASEVMEWDSRTSERKVFGHKDIHPRACMRAEDHSFFSP